MSEILKSGNWIDKYPTSQHIADLEMRLDKLQSENSALKKQNEELRGRNSYLEKVKDSQRIDIFDLREEVLEACEIIANYCYCNWGGCCFCDRQKEFLSKHSKRPLT